MATDPVEAARRAYQSPTKFTGWSNYGRTSLGTGAVQITGLKELHAALQMLPAKLEANVMRGALRAGVKEFETLARQKLVSHGHQALAAGLHVNTRLKKGKTTANVSTGNKKELFYAAWVEWGTATKYTGSGRSVRAKYHIKPKKKKALKFFWRKQGTWVVTKKGVMHPGAQGIRYMTKSFDEGAASAIRASAAYIRKRLEKYNAMMTSARESLGT